MVLSIIIGAVIVYLIAMIILHKLFEKFFTILFFGVSALFVIAVLYFVLKGI
ncbi:MAG: hypothetical protein Q8R04_00235 [Nanoarchaeota archaeon]|nr:hypothetical protein [Nanoarchaeota archaeon]